MTPVEVLQQLARKGENMKRYGLVYFGARPDDVLQCCSCMAENRQGAIRSATASAPNGARMVAIIGCVADTRSAEFRADLYIEQMPRAAVIDFTTPPLACASIMKAPPL